MSRSVCPVGIPSGFHLILYVAGDGPNSRIARENLARICENELAGHCTVRIVDVLEDFSAAVSNNILVTPTLLVCQPGHVVTIIGNLSDYQKVRTALGLEEARP
jgi:circadian clock protein KaiB